MIMETGTRRGRSKSWRDLPPGPPIGDPAAPASPPPPLPPPAPHSVWSRLWPALVIGGVVAVVVLAVWMVADGRESSPPEADAETTVDESAVTPTPAPAAPSEEADPGAPDTDPLEDFFGSSEFFATPGLPEDFLDRFGRNFFEEFGPEFQLPPDLLEQFPEDFFERFGRDFFDGFGFGLDPGAAGRTLEDLLPPEVLDQLSPELLNELEGLLEGVPFLSSEQLDELDELLNSLPDELRQQLSDLLSRFGGTFSFRFPDGMFEGLPDNLFDELPEGFPEQFREFFDRNFDSADPFGAPHFGLDGAGPTYRPTYLPEGYTLGATHFRLAQDDEGTARLEQRMRLHGPDGDIKITISTGANAAAVLDSIDGESTAVGGTSGKLVRSAGVQLLAFTSGETLFEVSSHDGVAVEELVRVAEGLEEG